MGARGPKSDKEWSDAIRKAVHVLREQKDADGKVRKIRSLNRLAENLVTLALGGDAAAIAAMKEIGDRLDGRAKSTIAGDSENPLRTIQRVIIDTENTDGPDIPPAT